MFELAKISHKHKIVVVCATSILMLIAILAVNIFSSQRTLAAITNWNPGRIIDDSVFTDTTTMNAQQIQQFLNSKVPTCDTWGAQQSEFGGGTRRQWAEANGYTAPFTCLKDYSENGLSSAQIIYNAAREFSINPQVLIVLLQKEQALVLDTWPIATQYRSATGYGCPDTAPCDSQYYGLTNQVRWSSRMFRAIMNTSPTWYTPYTLGNNYIRWSPDSACAGSIVNIENRSTQALYNYTPYQPNQSAINAGYSKGDKCGSYGNRNFYLYFTDWFGSTYAPTLSWLNRGILAYTDSSKTTQADLSRLKANQRIYISARVINTGNITWSNSGAYPIKIGTWGPQDRASQFCDTTWASCNRAATLQQGSVAPGQTGTFEYWMKVPSDNPAGWKFEDFNLLAENSGWFNGNGYTVSFTVQPTYAASLTDQVTFLDETKNQPIDLNQLEANQRFFVVTKVKNTGNVAWTNSGTSAVKIGRWKPFDGTSEYCDTSWSSCNRAATLKEPSVAPGQTGTFEYWMKEPNRSGYVLEGFNLLSEGIAWFEGVNINFASNTGYPDYEWDLVSQSAVYVDSQLNALTNSSIAMQPGQRVTVKIILKNTGNTVWRRDSANPTRLGTWNTRDRSSLFCDPTWPACNRPATLSEYAVVPGQSGTFVFTIDSPFYRGNHLEFYSPLSEGRSWYQDRDLYFKINN